MALFKITETEHSLNLHMHIGESANAFSLGAALELSKIQKKYAKWNKAVIVFSDHPRLFCSGGNLDDYKKLKSKAAGLKINREIETILNKFGSWRVPKIAVIEGDVLGGGMEWLARFDYRLATPQAFFAFWQRRIGLSSGWGGGRAWAAKIGEEPVRKLLLGGAILSASEARRFGLVDQIISGWKIRAEAVSLVTRLDAEIGLVNWESTREAKVFRSLWMEGAHKQALKSWK